MAALYDIIKEMWDNYLITKPMGVSLCHEGALGDGWLALSHSDHITRQNSTKGTESRSLLFTF